MSRDPRSPPPPFGTIPIIRDIHDPTRTTYGVRRRTFRWWERGASWWETSAVPVGEYPTLEEAAQEAARLNAEAERGD